MSEAQHHPWGEELAAYALDALDPDEARRVEAHLAECERCRADLRWLEPAVDVLAESVVQATPPARLREELVAITRSEARQAQPGGWRPGWRAWALRPATAIAATAIVAAGIAGYALRGGGTEGGPAVSEVPFESAPAAMGAVAVLERHGDSATLRVSNMPAIEDDDVYQVWIQHRDAVEPSSAFRPDTSGDATTTIPADLAGADAVLVTEEPERGRTRPTLPPLFEADLD
ncbi:MAG TPA: anti-sigma factor [Solirubrobacterales bacterium]|nr:anti-sigma factor [Solirubrobacterales bacterium]